MLAVAHRLLGLRPPRPNSKLYCTLPLDLNKNGLARICREPENWLVTLKADGERAWLMISKGEMGFISRTMRETLLPKSAFPSGIDTSKTTLLDGELIHQGSVFVAFDCLIFNNQSIHQQCLKQRAIYLSQLGWPVLQMVESNSPHGAFPSPSTKLQYWVKPILPVSQLKDCLQLPSYTPRDLFASQESAPIGCDGVIFMDGLASYFARSQMRSVETASMLKCKPTPTFDLAYFPQNEDEMMKNKTISLYCTGSIQPWIPCGSLKMLNGESPLTSKVVILECQCLTLPNSTMVSLADAAWSGIRIRHDKYLPNHEKVVRDTLEVIREGLTLSMLCDHLCGPPLKGETGVKMPSI